MTRLALVAVALWLPHCLAAQNDDLLLADFEGSDYRAWTTTGDAFGAGPARGTLPNQMSVSGFLGKGLVNSFHGGDRTTGTLTSPEFTVERDYLNFLVGGGGHVGKTCINLLVGGKVVRSATGPNTAPGGSEQLDWHAWDVKSLRGRKAILQIVDDHTGGWGHINVDHIVQSNQSKGTQPQRREFVVRERFLHLPVKNGAPKRRLKFVVDGQVVREFEIELAEAKPDFIVSSRIDFWTGKTLTVETVLPAGSTALERLVTDRLPNVDDLYREKHRPQYHFTARRGWLNDPNGLVYHDGTYHLFFQHNPYGWGWGNMHWGHAISKDLVHWEQLPTALYPKRFGDWCFSGSAVVDRHNTSGFKTGQRDVLVAAFTSTGRGECIVFSNDAGLTWQEHDGNPVVKHKGRDPRLLWHEATKRWVMAVYDEEEGKKIAFYSSPDLKDWTFHSRIGEFYECPDLFELIVTGKAKQSRWVLYAADGKYLVGDFDGRTFVPESKLEQVWHGNMYAAQTFSDAPAGRRIQIGWARVSFPGMPFNQQMTLPCELTLRDTDEGLRLCVQPVKELEVLRDKGRADADSFIREGGKRTLPDQAELIELLTEIYPRNEARCIFRLRGAEVVYDAGKQELSCKGATAPLRMKRGKVRLHIFVDRGSIEVFGNEGRVALSVGHPAPSEDRTVEIRAERGDLFLGMVEMHSLRSIWR